jgi:hypothetical protein
MYWLNRTTDEASIAETRAGGSCSTNQKGLKMKKDEAKVGMKVVVNDTPDATVYEIDSIDGFEASLIYQTRMGAVGAGWIDISILRQVKETAEHN